MPKLKEELEEFLQEIKPNLLASSSLTTSHGHSSVHQSEVVDALTKAADWAEGLACQGRVYEVCIHPHTCHAHNTLSFTNLH